MGGLIRNYQGKFIKGFLCNPGARNALLVELLVINLEIKMAIVMQLTDIILEIDCTYIFTMIQNHYTYTHHLQPLFNDVFSLIHLPKWTIQVNHIYREANYYADALTIRAHDRSFSCNIICHF